MTLRRRLKANQKTFHIIKIQKMAGISKYYRTKLLKKVLLIKNVHLLHPKGNLFITVLEFYKTFRTNIVIAKIVCIFLFLIII